MSDSSLEHASRAEQHGRVSTTGSPQREEKPAPDRWIGREIGGRFRIEAPIGSGAMARVYRAVALADGAPVAIKLLHSRLTGDPRVAQRFRREARAASRLSHPNALRILDFGEARDGTPFIAMELLNGEDLGVLIDHEAPLAPARIARLMTQALDALDEAHRAGVVHRDFKPENIMAVRAPDGAEHVKVCDFGMAKIVEGKSTSITRSGRVCGTPEYMAPEQARGQPVDLRADVYAAGVTLYQMLCGRVPFQGTSPLEVITKHVREVPVPPSEVRPEWDIPRALEAVALKALSKQPEDRYPSAADMAAAIVRAVEELDPSADPPRTVPTRDLSGSRAVRTRPSAPAKEGPGWLIGLALSIAVLAFGIWLWIR